MFEDKMKELARLDNKTPQELRAAHRYILIFGGIAGGVFAFCVYTINTSYDSAVKGVAYFAAFISLVIVISCLKAILEGELEIYRRKKRPGAGQ
jgi:hypothetical protein